MSRLFGRERELEELRAALESAEAGRGALALLVGEPGIGKTRLATAFADEAAARGARVTWGRAWEAGGAPEHWPWIDALRPLAADARAFAAEAHGDRAAPLARLLPELGAAPEPGDPGQERFRLFEAVSAFLAHAARERPLVLILDDLHAADPGTLALLLFVARGIRGVPLVIVGTYRDVEARLSAEAGETLSRVAREGRHLALARLGRDEIARWVEAEGRGDADALLAATEGNPLFVAEMLRLVRDRGLAPSGRLPDGVRDVIRARLTLLSPPARALLDAASVQGRAVDLALAAALADQPIALARDLAGEAARADVLVDARDRTAFTHILLREVVYQELSAARRAELHARIGRTLAERDAADEALSLAEAVHHLFAAAPEVPADEAIAWARRAAARAGRRLAFDEAAELLSRALELLPPGRDADRCAILLDLAAAQGGGGQSTRGRETAAAAADLARRMGDAEALAHAALRCGAAYLIAVVDRTLVGLLEEALDALPAGDSPLRARLLARLGAALQPAPDPGHPIALAREGLAMAGRAKACEADRLEVLVAVTSAIAYFADPAERLPLDTELVALAERAGDRVAVIRGHLRLAFDHLELGDTASADRTIDEYDRLSSAVGLPMLRWRAPVLRAMRALMDGRFAESDALCAEASAIVEQVDDRAGRATLALHRAGRLCVEGRLDELAAHLPVALEAPLRMDVLFGRAFRAGMLARLGRADEARGDLDFLLAHDPPLRGRPSMVWAADACMALGDATAAATLIDLLEPVAHRRYSWSPLGLVMEGPVSGWIDRLRALAGLAPQPTTATRAALRLELERDGDVWVLRADTQFRLRDSRGMRILAQLIAHPGREFHVTDLLAPAGEAGRLEDAGDALDPQAIAAYKERLEDLRDAEAEAEAHNDPVRAARARAEIDAIAGELARGVGLGGRARKASSTAEKARVNVRQRLHDAMTRIAEHSPALAKHLRQSIKTGAFCSYDP